MTSIYVRPVRFAAASLFAVACASLWWILAVLVGANDPPLTPVQLAELLFLFWLAPAAMAYLIRRICAGEVLLEGDALLLRRGDLRVEVPLDSIESVEPWALPLPAPGLSLRLGSGRWLTYVVATPELAAVLDRLAARLPAARAVAGDPAVAYARAKRADRGGIWRRPVVKYVLFATLPAAIFFNTHQHIAYGGTFGQYYLEGLGPWVQTFAVYWATMSMYLLLYASVWRGLAEGVALLVTRIAPSQAAAVRRAVEVACLVVYYGGVPVLIALRFSA